VKSCMLKLIGKNATTRFLLWGMLFLYVAARLENFGQSGALAKASKVN
jgi:hypothetical protein